VPRNWELRLDPDAVSDLNDLDESVRKRVWKFLSERLTRLEDPRSIGEALKGTRLGDLWRYRVGDYRVMARIEDRVIEIVVVRIGHRREIYR
jgi:mRNA interferase RelE/StbE